jgi:hypothetical protein
MTLFVLFTASLHLSLVSIPFRVSFFDMFKRRFLLSSSTLPLLLSAQAIVVSAECAGSQSLSAERDCATRDETTTKRLAVRCSRPRLNDCLLFSLLSFSSLLQAMAHESEGESDDLLVMQILTGAVVVLACLVLPSCFFMTMTMTENELLRHENKSLKEIVRQLQHMVESRQDSASEDVEDPVKRVEEN